MYNIFRSLLFYLEPELAHSLSLKLLHYAPSFLFKHDSKSAPIKLMGLNFPNRVGLAAGLDKNGEYIDALAKLGFGFLEIGTITPKPQAGNSKPRLFRLVEDRAIINRMGFNNKGVDYLINQVEQAQYQGLLGINIGKNLSTPVSKAVDDYLYCLEKVYRHASYITVNVSSPNTPGLRELQRGQLLAQLFGQLKQRQQQLADKYQRYVPMVAKLSPDEDESQLKTTVQSLTELCLEGLIFSNTTSSRPALKSIHHINQAGGLSGAPLISLATKGLTTLKNYTDLPIIGVGGIASGQDALAKLKAGAELIQLYTGLIYQGPQLVQDCIHTTKAVPDH